MTLASSRRQPMSRPHAVPATRYGIAVASGVTMRNPAWEPNARRSRSTSVPGMPGRYWTITTPRRNAPTSRRTDGDAL